MRKVGEGGAAASTRERNEKSSPKELGFPINFMWKGKLQAVGWHREETKLMDEIYLIFHVSKQRDISPLLIFIKIRMSFLCKLISVGL